MLCFSDTRILGTAFLRRYLVDFPAVALGISFSRVRQRRPVVDLAHIGHRVPALDDDHVCHRRPSLAASTDLIGCGSA